MTTCTPISPEKAKKMLAHDARLIDIRELDEHARENIGEAQCKPLSTLSSACLQDIPKDTPIIFHCQSGNRTKQAEKTFLSLGFNHIYILDGGLNAWKKCGYNTSTNTKHPLPLMRQVQIIVGFMVVLGVILSYTVSPYFNLLSAFFGAGLLFAGLSGFCGLANVLMLLPYNKHK